MMVSRDKTKKDFKQAGISDRTIVCQACESRFSKYDDHGYRVFTNVFRQKKVYSDHQGNRCAYLLPRVDYHRLKLFVLSLLWRASVSQHLFFRRVTLGPHQETIRSMIDADDAGGVDDYSFACIHHLNQRYENIILPPVTTRIATLRCVRFYLPNITIIVKTDKRPFTEPFRTIMIAPKPPHYLAFMPYQGSLEHKYLAKTVELFQQNKIC